MGGGPHNHQIGGLAAQLLEVNTPEFVEYSKAVIANSKALADHLMGNGHKLATDGTGIHLVEPQRGARRPVCAVSWRSPYWHTGHDHPRLHHGGLQEDRRVPGPMCQDRVESAGG